ncbi:YebC/PmpR family DNA-binding transcriptional regulator [bacterium]|nr:YebC/PmpR family DNA-binding transcriptional regulator [bacterium]MBU1752619.1 YebC/PmpR family DNA-binding transcriptional regulator [bacterium]
MSGHSKWATIKHKKGALDAQRGKLFSRMIKEITLAARDGGNPDMNPRLRTVIESAKEVNMPSDNIKRAIQRGTGELPGVIVEEINYEGYGPGGIAVLVETMTDNRNRITAEVRKIFSRSGGSLGEAGCVSWMFSKKGCIGIKKEQIDEDSLLEIAMEACADDVKTDDAEVYEIITNPGNFLEIKEALKGQKIPMEYEELSMIPQSYIKVEKDLARQVLNLVENLEENDDVSAVYTNADISDEIMAELQG